MKTLALVSACGRAGRTTLTASLASMLAHRGHTVLAIEFDPQNLLGMHLGLASPPIGGLSADPGSKGAWADAALCNADGVTFLPFGQLDAAALFDFEHQLATQPAWLAERLAMIDAPTEQIVLIDAARLPSVYAAQALRAADYVLVLLQAEGEFFATLDAVQLALRNRNALAEPDADEPPAHVELPHGYVMNAFDTHRPLQHDVQSAMMARLGARLSPYVVHRDESIPAAFARLAFVADQFPNSLAVHDFNGLCDWLMAQSGIAALASEPEPIP